MHIPGAFGPFSIDNDSRTTESGRNSDFVVKRKRKRHPMDPCLGFYHVSSQTLSQYVAKAIPLRSVRQSSFASSETGRNPLTSKALLSDGSTGPTNRAVSTTIQPVSVTSDPSSTSRSPAEFESGPSWLPATPALSLLQDSELQTTTLTDESFLKNSAKAVKKSRHKRARIIPHESSPCYSKDDIVVSVDAELELNDGYLRSSGLVEDYGSESSSEGRSSSSALRTYLGQTSKSGTKKQASKKIKTRSIRKRLFKAGVLAYGNPVDDLILPAGSGMESSRRPLTSIPSAQSPTVPRRRMTLVDPRKMIPVPSSFITPVGRIKPLTAWSSVCKQATSKSVGLGKPRHAKSVAPQTLQPPPLLFVPLEEAERAYQGKQRNKERACVGVLHRVIESPPATLNTSNTRPTSSTTPLPPYRKSSDAISGAQRNMQDHCFPEYPDMPTVPLSAETCQQDNLPVLDYQNNSVSTPAEPAADEFNEPQKTKKPLRPLASFFDQFLETIRAATQVATNTNSTKRKSKLPKGHRDRPSRSTPVDDPVSLHYNLDPAGTLIKSFIRTSVRSSCSSVPFRNPPIYYSDPSSSSHQLHPPTEENFSFGCSSIASPDGSYPPLKIKRYRDISPDILAALEPKEYEVVLSSPCQLRHARAPLNFV